MGIVYTYKLHGFKIMAWILDHQVICQGSPSSHPTFEKRHQSALADQSRRSHLPVAQSHMATGKSIVNLKVVFKKRDLISTLWFQPKWKLLICQKKTSPNRSEQEDMAAIKVSGNSCAHFQPIESRRSSYCNLNPMPANYRFTSACCIQAHMWLTSRPVNARGCLDSIKNWMGPYQRTLSC